MCFRALGVCFNALFFCSGGVGGGLAVFGESGSASQECAHCQSRQNILSHD